MLRLAKVPMPKGVAAVSPPITRTRSMGTSRASAQTWAKEVWWPWPWAEDPVPTVTVPWASTVTVAPSNGPMPVPST
jgi:hypothetical protein